MDDIVFKGAYRDNPFYSNGSRRSCETWHMSNETEKLLALADEDNEQVLWVSTPEELHRIMEERYPGRCRYLPRGCSIFPYPVVTDDGLSSSDTYRDAYAARIIEAAAKHGTVSVAAGNSIPSAVWESCISSDDGAGVTYDPLKAQKLKVSQAKANLRRPVPADTFHHTALQLRRVMNYRLDIGSIDGNEGRIGYMHRIRRLLWLCEKLYGKRSYRRLACWHEFVKDWRKLQKPTEKTLARTINDLDEKDDDRAFVAEFIAFMGRECQRRLPPVIADDELHKRLSRLPLPH